MNILVTGGAGFIGSNLVKELLERSDIHRVRVLDNFETGHYSNLDSFSSSSKFELVEGDIRNYNDCLRACDGMDAVSHQAALGSVPRSINDPVASHKVNVNGFINIIEAARQKNIKRFVYASSSSVYGDLAASPKREDIVGKILSPYAATKVINEHYAEAYARNYGMTCVGLRYFNVFGPKQDPNGPYAAVIPLFIRAALSGKSPIVNGDGTITRDFTPVSNVVECNISGLTRNLESSVNYILNVACGRSITLKELWQNIKKITDSSVEAINGPLRKGDVLFSLADITKAKAILGYSPCPDIYPKLEETISYYRQNLI